MTHCTNVLPVFLKGETCFGLDSMESFWTSLTGISSLSGLMLVTQLVFCNTISPVLHGLKSSHDWVTPTMLHMGTVFVPVWYFICSITYFSGSYCNTYKATFFFFSLEEGKKSPTLVWHFTLSSNSEFKKNTMQPCLF